MAAVSTVQGSMDLLPWHYSMVVKNNGTIWIETVETSIYVVPHAGRFKVRVVPCTVKEARVEDIVEDVKVKYQSETAPFTGVLNDGPVQHPSGKSHSIFSLIVQAGTHNAIPELGRWNNRYTYYVVKGGGQTSARAVGWGHHQERGKVLSESYLGDAANTFLEAKYRYGVVFDRRPLYSVAEAFGEGILNERRELALEEIHKEPWRRGPTHI